MKKIPTIFVRDWEGSLGPPARLVLDEPHPDCGWVFAGEGVATRKLDGTCCLVRGGKLFKRHEVKIDKKTGELRAIPGGFEEIDRDETTGALVGWVPVGDGPEDARHREAFARELSERGRAPDGTYELIGPSVNGNPERVARDEIIAHEQAQRLGDVPLSYEGLKEYLSGVDYEGIVWHHSDGRMAKIKARDFGIVRRGE